MIIVSAGSRSNPSNERLISTRVARSSKRPTQRPVVRYFHLSADPIKSDRINVFEQWRTSGDVESFRQDGPDADLQTVILGASVHQHEIASTTPLA